MNFFRKNPIPSVIIGFYLIVTAVQINWGGPNRNHPFTYHMDEWQDFKIIANLYKHLTPNLPEANGNGFVFYYFSQGLLIVPYILLGIINPFIIHSPLDAIDMQARIFTAFRVNTLLFGALTIFFLAKIVREHLRANLFTALFFFVLTPIWLELSNYGKYDIPALFWVVLSLWLLMEFGKNKKLRYYVGAGITTGLAIATKASGLPLFGVYLLSYFLYIPRQERKISQYLTGIVTCMGVFILTGIPDLLIGRGSYAEYFYSNLVKGPATSFNYILGSPWYVYLWKNIYPAIFGHAMFLLFLVSLGYILLSLRIKDKNLNLVLISLAAFEISLVTLKLYAWGARAVVLLPYPAILISVFISRVKKTGWVTVLLLISMLYQFTESIAWVSIKLLPDPRATSSIWIQKNIPAGSLIGIENIPVYQMLPDIVDKEYHENLYNLAGPRKLSYEIVYPDSIKLPGLVIVSDADAAVDFFDTSPKKDLVLRLKREGYQETRFLAPLKYYKYFGDKKSFYFAKLVAAPVSVSVFSKTTL